MTSTRQSILRPWLFAALASAVVAGMPALAAPTLGVALEPVAPPVDGRVLSRAAYVGLLLLAMGTAWFLLLVPVAAPISATLRRVLSVLAVGGLLAGGLLAGGLNLPQLNAVAVVGFAALLIGAWRGHRGALLGGAVALAVSRALIGHPASLDPGAVLMPLMILHVSCASFWVGSLWPLHRLLGSETPSVAAPSVARFSGLALAAVGTLAVVGIVTAAIHLRVPDALLENWYGQLVIMKTTWFTVLMGIAAYHKRRLTPRLAAGDGRAARQMRWGIRIEAVIMLIVILLSALLASTPPGAPPPKSGSNAGLAGVVARQVLVFAPSPRRLLTRRSPDNADPA
ncbi:MAG: CopD family protein [Gammaproteobacteria bacterium]|nr:CopD family protein [Gammaproteobacteria bacterium]